MDGNLPGGGSPRERSLRGKAQRRVCGGKASSLRAGPGLKRCEELSSGPWGGRFQGRPLALAGEPGQQESWWGGRGGALGGGTDPLWNFSWSKGLPHHDSSTHKV